MRYDESSPGNASPAGDCDPLAFAFASCPDGGAGGLALSDGLTAVPVADDDDADVDEDMPGETRGGRFDLVATVRAVRPLKIESSSKCSLSSV